jgi:hypothetical protein
LVRTAGGRLSVSSATSGGALFEIELRSADAVDTKDTVEARGAAVSS